MAKIRDNECCQCRFSIKFNFQRIFALSAKKDEICSKIFGPGGVAGFFVF